MQQEIDDYCKNFYIFRQHRALEIVELLDITVFIMIEVNIYYSTIAEKEEFALGIMRKLINTDITNPEENKSAIANMEYYIGIMKRQLWKESCSYKFGKWIGKYCCC